MVMPLKARLRNDLKEGYLRENDVNRRLAEEWFLLDEEAWQTAVAQDDTNALLVSLARDGKRVLRLKGGDPNMFGRGGEEALELARAGIPFRFLPGLTAAFGALAAANIPATMRGHRMSCPRQQQILAVASSLCSAMAFHAILAISASLDAADRFTTNGPTSAPGPLSGFT
jgi:precorrin-4 methylase